MIQSSRKRNIKIRNRYVIKYPEDIEMPEDFAVLIKKNIVFVEFPFILFSNPLRSSGYFRFSGLVAYLTTDPSA